MPDLSHFIVRGFCHRGRDTRDYNAGAHRYRPDHVYPQTWGLELDASAAVTELVTPPPPVDLPDAVPEPLDKIIIPANVIAYEWQVEKQQGANFHVVATSRSPRGCKVAVEVPTEGQYQARFRVTLTVRLNDGPALSRTQMCNVQEFLIVSLGDSYASGQGNPDVRGEPSKWVPLSLTIPLDCPMKTAPVWKEPAAQRSYVSGPSIAVEFVEFRSHYNDARELIVYVVIFLSFASSGAEIQHIVDRPQHAWQEMSQVAEAKRAVQGRTIDALLLSVGGNNAGFSSTLTTLARDHLRSDTGSSELDAVYIALIGVELWYLKLSVGLAFVGNDATRKVVQDESEAKIKELGAGYQRLASEIDSGLAPKTVYITEYPTGIFDLDDGSVGACGLFDLGIAQVTKEDVDLISYLGKKLNEMIAASVTAINTETRGQPRAYWYLVDGIDGSFARHGYCAKESYFRQAEESCRHQGDINGTMHPNGSGHRAYASHIEQFLKKYILSQGPSTAPNRVKLSVSSSAISFSTTVVGEIQSRALTFSNAGNVDLRITIAPRSAAISWRKVDDAIKPGEQLKVTIDFRPKSKGAYEEILTFQSTPATPPRQISISGRAIGGPSSDPNGPRPR